MDKELIVQGSPTRVEIALVEDQKLVELHQQKTRIIEFGRFAGRNRKARGLGKPETFDFLASPTSVEREKVKDS